MEKIALIILDTSLFSIDDLLASISLSSEQIEEINKTKLIEKKKEKLASIYLKNKYISSYTFNEYKKPIADDICFNISHSRNYVILGLSNVDIGIDIEHIEKVSNEMKIYICSKEEKQYVKNDVNFYELWTNKESLMKCIGKGIINRIDEIVGLPINGLKSINNISYYSKTLSYKDNIICITLQTDEQFDVELIHINQL